MRKGVLAMTAVVVAFVIAPAATDALVVFVAATLGDTDIGSNLVDMTQTLRHVITIVVEYEYHLSLPGWVFRFRGGSDLITNAIAAFHVRTGRRAKTI